MSLLKNLARVLPILLLCIACSSRNVKEKVTIYTSAYPETVKRLDEALRAQYPDLDPQWFQNGSENVAAKIALERLSNKVNADVVMTSDFFWFRKMQKEGFWQPYHVNTPYTMPSVFEGKDHSYTTARVSAVVIGYNKKFVSEVDAPRNFSDLKDPKWSGKITSASPLESGTCYMLMNSLVYKYGYEFLSALKANDLLSAGGNGAAVTRLSSGQRPVAMTLLENLLAEQKKNPDIAIVYPEDGTVLVPSPVGIVKGSEHLAAAQKVYDFFLSSAGQKLFTLENLYVPDPSVVPPAGARPLVEVQKTAFDLDDKFYDFVSQEDPMFKNKYSDIILN